MAKFCFKCGNPISGDAQFCAKCGATVNANDSEGKTIPQKNTVKTPEAEPAAIQGGAIGDYFKANIEKIGKLIKNPKALFKAILPSIIIAVVWTVLAFLEMAYPNSAVIRVFSFFTYAQGGMFGGFLGALGGIVGKALFAYLLCSIVNAVVNKRKISFKEIFTGLKIDGLSTLGCFLIGAGAAVLLYLAMNLTSSAQNAMIGVAGAIMIVISAGQKNGLLLMAVCGLAKLVMRGKAPSQVTVSRVMSGMATGFIIAVPLSMLRSAWICPIVCLVFLAVGILILVCGSKSRPKKAIAAMFALTIALSPLMSVIVSATDKTAASGDWVDPYVYWNLENTTRNEMYNKMKNSELKAIAFELKPIFYAPSEYSDTEHYKITDFTASNEAWVVELNKPAESFKLTYNTVKNIDENQYYNDSYELNIKDFTLLISENSTYTYKYKAVISGTEKTYQEFRYGGSQPDTNSYEGSINNSENKAFSLETDDEMLMLYINFLVEGELSRDYLENSDVGRVTEKTARNGDSKIAFQISRVLLSDSADITGSSGWVVDNEMGGDDDNTDGGSVKSDETRKGVPLKDYDGDGDIDYNDRVIQYELIHDPDYLTRAGKAGATVVAILSLISAILGGAAGAVGGGAAGAAAGVASGALGATGAGSVGAANPYIKFDSAGDIEWTDPATGKMTQYVRQKDGKYKNPLTDQSYTYDELSENADYRERNAESFAQDAETAEQNVEEQRAESGGLSDNAKEHAEFLRQLDAIAKDREKKINLANKYRLSPDMDNDEFVKTVLAKMAKEQERGKQYAAQGDRMAVYEGAAETVSTAADLGMDALATVTGPVGKGINAGYKVVKGAAGKGAEEANYSDGNVTTGIMQGAIEGGIDAANDYLGGGAKVAGTVVGETAKGGLDSYIKGEDVTEGMKSGAKKGVLNATMDMGADAIGGKIKQGKMPGKSKAGLTDAINSASSDDAAKKIAGNFKKASQAVDVGTNVTDNVAKKVAENAMKEKKK